METKFSILTMFNLKYLLDIQVEKSSKQLDILAQSSEEKIMLNKITVISIQMMMALDEIT